VVVSTVSECLEENVESHSVLLIMENGAGAENALIGTPHRGGNLAFFALTRY
jgi:hypothetical protein